MKREALPKWLARRGGKLVYRRRVPRRYASFDKRPFVTVSCETADVGKAVVARDKINALTESYWRALARGEDPGARDRYVAAVDRARLEGFTYAPVANLLDMPVEGLLDRIDVLERLVAASGTAAAAPKPKPDERQLVTSLLGREKEPGLTLSKLVATFEALTRDERLKKSEQQIHKWRLPHDRAVRNLQTVIGDKAIADFSRADALAFRDWWLERLEEGGLSVESANKDFAHLGHMIAIVSDRHDLELQRRFRGLRFKKGNGGKRPPFSSAFIIETILAPGRLDGLNASARAVVLVMIETGARPSEIVALRPGDIDLAGAIPFMSIDEYEGRDMKTRFSKREIPLVGVALDGARLLVEGNMEYRGRGDVLSATVNKFLAENKLRETPDHSLYSFRHSFKDRLTDASAPDIIDSSLMGHKFDRPDYGKGPSLKLKLEWIMKICLTGRPASSST